jgi:phosphatidylserine/phosphatidylglycerophosphate/cardiolipin synthase-like enzyme
VNGAVNDANDSFQEFWDSEIVVPIASIMDEPDFEPERAWQALHEYSCNPAHFIPAIRQRVTNLPNALRERLTGDFAHSIEKVEYISDPPGKNDDDGMWGGGTTTSRLMELVSNATESVLIQSPYLVTTELSQGLFRSVIERGVSVKIITNSLSVTDNYQAFSGYQRSRQALLDVGVEIYELRPNAGMQSEIMNGPEEMRFNSSLAVHAKSLVVDFNVAVIGSFNLDPRSANLNTECITVLHSETIANQLARQIQQDMAPENSWHTTSDFNPDSEAPFSLRFKSWLARIMPESIL